MLFTVLSNERGLFWERRFRGDGAVPSEFFPLNFLPHTRWNTGREASEREDEFTSLYRSELKEMSV